jgi:glycosyltransferase involved in cell wall biosynthesis
MFGKAKRVPRWWLNWSVRRRRAKAVALIQASRKEIEFEPRKVSLVILSCKRLPQLQRLVAGLEAFLDKTEVFSCLEKILVDNGSGPQLVEWARGTGFFDSIIAHKNNLGMAVALNDAFPKAQGEYILLLEEDFIIDYQRPFLDRCINLFDEYPEIGIIRLKDQRNWGKPFRIIGPLRKTREGTEFWTWLPSFNGKLNVWTAGSVMFRKISFTTTGSIPVGPNLDRHFPTHQGILYEEVYGKIYNRKWLAAKIRNCCPFFQPDDNEESPGWGDLITSID